MSQGIIEQFQKDRSAIKNILRGKEFFQALKAMDFAEQLHTGVRKDGVTPEFDHQVQIALTVEDLHHLIYPEETFATVFLHDVVEDYNIGIDTIDRQFGQRVGNAVWRLTKKTRATTKSAEGYFEEMATDPIASIVKGADRDHNFQSMPGVFTLQKQLDYIAEAEGYILPMLKVARSRFPEQTRSYFALKRLMIIQIKRDRHFITALREIGAALTTK